MQLQPRATNGDDAVGVYQDYWFDLQLVGDAKRVDTYAYGGFLIDTQEDPDGSSTWAELLSAATDAVCLDIDQWGVIT